MAIVPGASRVTYILEGLKESLLNDCDGILEMEPTSQSVEVCFR